VADDGTWRIDLALHPGRNDVTFVAEDSAGEQTTVRVPVVYGPTAPERDDLIGVVFTYVDDPIDSDRPTLNRVLNVGVEPHQPEDLWSYGGWVVDYRAEQPDWGLSHLVHPDPRRGLSDPPTHLVTLDQLVGRDDTGGAIWLVRDVVTIGALPAGEQVHDCRQREATAEAAWPAVGVVRDDPIEGEWGYEVPAINAWRIDFEAGRLVPVDASSVLCIPEMVDPS
jgi:hypothetical protein